MTIEIDPIELGPGPVGPIPWEKFKAEIRAGWPGPPHCSKSHAGMIDRTIRAMEALDLAGDGAPPRAIATTADLTLGLVAKLLEGRPPGESAHTTKGYLSALRILCTYAEAHRWVAISPFRLRKMSRLVRTGPPANKRAATREEIRRVLGLMRGDVEQRAGWAQWRARRLYAVTALVAYTGVRRNEGLMLHVEDLDFGAGIINLVPRGTTFKTEASAQPVPMPPALAPILRDWLDHRLDRPHGYPMPPAGAIPWLFPTCNRKAAWIWGSQTSRAIARLKAAAKRAGVPDLTFQMLRRSWATHAEYFGVGPAMIQRVLRHTRAQTTETFYRKADLTNMAEAVKGFEF
jgi:integrase